MADNNYKYRLQKYSGMTTKRLCPQCRKRSFTLYVDDAGNAIADNVGRCDHESSCGYHLTPSEYFKQNPNERGTCQAQEQSKPQPVRTDYVPNEFIDASRSVNNSLMRFLLRYFYDLELEIIAHDYQLGSSRDGSILYPQIDIDGRCRSGKFMNYDENGHRIKNAECDKVDWLHSRILREQLRRFERKINRKMSAEERKEWYRDNHFNLSQCLFGEHLLTKYPDKIVCLVESEKTAIIMAMQMSNYLWLATGGENNFKPELLKVLQGRNVVVFEDADVALAGKAKETFAKSWRGKAEQMRRDGFLRYFKSFEFSDWADDEPLESKRDIADVVLEQMEMAIKARESEAVKDDVKEEVKGCLMIPIKPYADGVINFETIEQEINYLAGNLY